MLEVGNIVRSKYTVDRHRARIGIVMQLREGAYEDQPLAQVYWPHRRATGWVETKDMEVVDAT